MKATKIIALIILIAIPGSSFAWSGRGAGSRPGFHRGAVNMRFTGHVPPRFFFNRNRFFFPNKFFFPNTFFFPNRFFFAQSFFPGSYSYDPSGYAYPPYAYQPFYPSTPSYDTVPPPPAGTAEDVYNRGYSEGYSKGYEEGQKEREKERYEEGQKRGYEEGYNAGKESQDP